MSIQPVVQYASRTDVGMRRAVNQDSLAVRLCDDYEEWVRCGHLFAVADGMGGHSVGELASQITVETLPMAYRKADVETIEQRLRVAIRSAHQAIQAKAQQNPEFADMGTTCSVLSLSDRGAWVGHVGDSRVYRVRDGSIEQLTFDHSLQWEVIRRGQATPEAAELLHPRNVITRCLGPDERVEIDGEGPFDVQPGDRFVLCSDGLTGHVTDSEIGWIVSELSAAEATWLLVDLANCRGGSDNTTVVVVAVEDYPPVVGETVDRALSRGRTNGAVAESGAAINRPVRWRGWFSVVFGIVAFTGLVLLALERRTIGLILVCVALLLGIVRLMYSADHEPVLSSEPEAGLLPSNDLNVGGMAIAERSPYRRASFVHQSQFLTLLSAAQNELTEAARDNGWEIDYDELENLARQAVGETAPDGQLRVRAQAMKILMKEFSTRLRPGKG